MADLNQWIEVDGCGAMPTSLIFSMEQLNITTVNSFPPVTFVPAGGLFELTINATTYTPVDGSFTLSGQNIVWTSPFITVNPGDTVVAVYSYQG